MTRVRYDRAGLRLEMEGHAGAGAKGTDTVCAALSMLMMTLEARCLERAEQTLPVLRRAPGRFMIACRPAEEDEVRCRESFDTVFAGLSLLAENRPACVSVTLTDSESDEEENDE